MKIYICGPISGQREESKKHFTDVEKQLIKKGYDVVNPHNIPHKDVDDWDQCMKEDIPEMLKCDMVFLLSGWWQSRGAQIEVNLVDFLHIKKTKEIDHEIYEEQDLYAKLHS